MKNLENNGERMDINYYNMDYNSFNIYQKSHYKRYEFACKKLDSDDIVGDMACGSGYGSIMLSKYSKNVKGYDIDSTTIEEITNRYSNEKNVNFEVKNLLNVNDKEFYDKIISFETIEHFTPSEISELLLIFHSALKNDGKLIFSTPYNQEQSNDSMKFHKTFYITETTIKDMLKDLFEIEEIYYQDYITHEFKNDGDIKHFIICVVRKK